MSIIDFSDLPLSPNESRAARNFLGLSQTQASVKSELPAHKIKRFETGSYVPDTPFLKDLREFFENEGHSFNDADTPGAKARAKGDVFQGGVIGKTDGSIGEPSGFPVVQPGKPTRPQQANVQYMRVSPDLDGDQIDRVFTCIEDNETALHDASSALIVTGFLESTPSTKSQALAISMLRRLAENGLMYAHLQGRDLLPVADIEKVPTVKAARSSLFGGSSETVLGSWKTIGDLMQAAMTDVQLAVIEGDKDAQARRKSRVEPTEVLQAVVG